jgi:hypothetical protein
MVVAQLAGLRERWCWLAGIGLFASGVLGLAGWLDQPIYHLRGDDSYRYSIYAWHILEQGSLWGHGGVLRPAAHFADQPGYRYWLAAMIGLTGGETRLTQVTNLAVLLLACGVFLHGLARAPMARWQRLSLAIFLLLAAPYMAKNVIYGYVEWFAVALLLLLVVSLWRGWLLTAMLLLGLIPFIRQNLILFAGALALVIALVERRPWLLLPFVAVLLLPLYHNLWYAGEWRLLVTNRGALLDSQEGVWSLLRNVIHLVAFKAAHYIGYHSGEKPLTLFIAVLFVPLGTVLMALQLWRLDGWRRGVYVLLAVLAIGPTVLFGGGSFPRFVFVNQFAVLAAALALVPGPGMRIRI